METINKFQVRMTGHNDKIYIAQLPSWPPILSPDDAINLAAHLVSIAEQCESCHYKFADVMMAVVNTNSNEKE